MRLSTIAFLAANAALASASAAFNHNANLVIARDVGSNISPANDTDVYILKQWNPRDHLEKRNNDHKPSPSPHHPSAHHPSSSYGPSKHWNPEEPTSKPPGPSQYHHHPPTDTSEPPHGSDAPPNNGEHTPVTSPHGDKPTHWPSASARARLPHDTTSFALYGQAAASVCGLNGQVSGAEITACPLDQGSNAWDCINTASTLESCGGCMSLDEGEDCTLIKGVDSVGCVHGKCVIGSCGEGYWLDAEKMECVANSED